MAKSFLRSKTFWINFLTLLGGTVGYVAAHDVLQGQEQLLAALVAVQGAVNIVLRFITTTPIK